MSRTKIHRNTEERIGEPGRGVWVRVYHATHSHGPTELSVQIGFDAPERKRPVWSGLNHKQIQELIQTLSDALESTPPRTETDMSGVIARRVR